MFGNQQKSSGVPLQQVIQLRGQGMSDNQIVQTLQGQGYGSQQIFDALSQADVAALPSDDLNSSMPGMPPGPYPPQPPQPAQQDYDQPEDQTQNGYDPYTQQPPAWQQPTQPGMDEERIEEVVEAIVNERWEELLKEVKKIAAWKEKIDTQVQKTTDAIDNLKEDVNQLRAGILGKINEYDQHMRDVSTDLQAVQKVFKEVVPEFTRNVGELSRITKATKGPTAKK